MQTKNVGGVRIRSVVWAASSPGQSLAQGLRRCEKLLKEGRHKHAKRFHIVSVGPGYQGDIAGQRWKVPAVGRVQRALHTWPPSPLFTPNDHHVSVTEIEVPKCSVTFSLVAQASGGMPKLPYGSKGEKQLSEIVADGGDGAGALFFASPASELQALVHRYRNMLPNGRFVSQLGDAVFSGSAGLIQDGISGVVLHSSDLTLIEPLLSGLLKAVNTQADTGGVLVGDHRTLKAVFGPGYRTVSHPVIPRGRCRLPVFPDSSNGVVWPTETNRLVHVVRPSKLTLLRKCCTDGKPFVLVPDLPSPTPDLLPGTLCVVSSSVHETGRAAAYARISALGRVKVSLSTGRSDDFGMRIQLCTPLKDTREPKDPLSPSLEEEVIAFFQTAKIPIPPLQHDSTGETRSFSLVSAAYRHYLTQDVVSPVETQTLLACTSTAARLRILLVLLNRCRDRKGPVQAAGSA